MGDLKHFQILETNLNSVLFWFFYPLTVTDVAVGFYLWCGLLLV